MAFSPFAGHKREGESGAAAVEFALIAPLLFILVFGIINFGYLFGQKLSLNQAAREGARLAVVDGGTTPPGDAVNTLGEIETIVNNSHGLVPQGEIDVRLFDDASNSAVETDGSAGCGALDVGDQLRLEAEYEATPLISLPFLSGAFDMKSTAVFRCEW